MVRGLFADDRWSIDTMGGFSSDTTAGLISASDLVVVFGASLNRWTTRGGTLLKSAQVVQIDTDPHAFGRDYDVDRAVLGDSELVADALVQMVPPARAARYRTPHVEEKIRTSLLWRDVPFEDTSTSTQIDPRTLTIALDDLVPADRSVTFDGGNFCAYPAMFLGVRPGAYCMPLAFQSIGLSLGAGIGAALARPDRVSVVGVGDGGFMMSLVELDTAVRLQLPLLVVVYDDHAYGAEVHHFDGPGVSMDTVTFPDTDLAAIARGFGCEGAVVRSEQDLVAVDDWLRRGARAPLVIDAKMTSFPSWMLAHTFAHEENAT